VTLEDALAKAVAARARTSSSPLASGAASSSDQMRTVMSSEHEASSRPAEPVPGEKDTRLISSSWPRNVRIGVEWPIRQTWIVLSLPPEASVSLSIQSTSRTQSGRG
jgi:hypothetical protein